MKRIIFVSGAALAGAFFLTAFASTAGIRLPLPAIGLKARQTTAATAPPTGCAMHANAKPAKTGGSDGCCEKKAEPAPQKKDACCEK